MLTSPRKCGPFSAVNAISNVLIVSIVHSVTEAFKFPITAFIVACIPRILGTPVTTGTVKVINPCQTSIVFGKITFSAVWVCTGIAVSLQPSINWFYANRSKLNSAGDCIS